MANPTEEYVKFLTHAADARARLEVARGILTEALKDLGLVSQYAADHTDAALKDLGRAVNAVASAVYAAE